MSVINQMLKDLDNRQKQSAGMQFATALHLRSATDNTSAQRREVMLWSVLLVCAVLLCLLLWQGGEINFPFPTAQQKKVVTTLSDPKVRQALQNLAIKDVQITNAGWQFHRSGAASLNLHFSRLPDEPITQTNKPNGETEFVMPSVNLEAALPILNAEDSPIESYQFNQRERDLVLTVKPAASVDLTISSKPTGTEEQVSWVLTATPVMEQVAETVKPVATVRKPVHTVNSSATDNHKPTIKKVKIPRASYQRALNYLQEARVAPAVTELQKVLQQNPADNESRELLANLYRQTGRSTEAIVLLQEGIKIDPSYLAFTRIYADSLIANGQLEQAARVLGNSAGYAQNDADYHALQAAVAQRLSRHQLAIGYYMKALEIQPKNGAWWMGLAISLEALDKNEAAAGAYAAAIDSGQLKSELLTYVNARLQSLERNK
ncbi:MAG: tetratricopeptide repeat protein [Gammaproteobacteria bacterium]|nr:tetratricopeptide repeat protein [Gammaproteobacteria bacterium]